MRIMSEVVISIFLVSHPQVANPGVWNRRPCLYKGVVNPPGFSRDLEGQEKEKAEAY
jgi:hypothetical protein